MIIRKSRKDLINRIRKNPENCFLKFKEFGKSNDIKDYSDDEIWEMYRGIYRSKDHKMLLGDGDLFIDLNDVIKIGCTLEKVTYVEQPKKSVLTDSSPIALKTICNFHVKDYFLITAGKVNGSNRHLISRFLWKIGAIRPGTGQYSSLFSIHNSDLGLQNFKEGLFPRDLYIPIETNINQLFFRDDNRFNDFVVESKIQFND